MSKDEEDRSDGLEIISIGRLYIGAWDKKYWSSSRGKDRYPFPIGYKAVRTCSGVTYQMEILEGNKGPSFSITSTDGLACSGQTPDMAWEIFQKKGCPRIKLWRGKRFSCKINGVEFFGFKNTFVQRLLRELVTHNGSTAEHFSSGSVNEDSSNKNQSSRSESCIETTNIAPLPDIETPQTKCKTSRKLSSINPNPIDDASSKKIRPKDDHPKSRVPQDIGVCNNGTSDLVHKNYNDYKHEPFLTSAVLNEGPETHNNASASVVSANIKSNSSVNSDLSAISFHSFDHLAKVEEPPKEEQKLVKSKLKGKRTQRVRASKPDLSDVTSCKNIQPKDGSPDDRGLHDDEVHGDETLYSGHKDQGYCKLQPSLTSASKGELEIQTDATILVESVNLETVIEERSNPLPVEDDLAVIACQSSDRHAKGKEPHHEEEKPLKSMSTQMNLEISQVKGKRNRRVKSSIFNRTDVASCKRIRSKDESQDDRASHNDEVLENEISDLGHKNHKNQCGPSLTSSALSEKPEIHYDARAPVMSKILETDDEGKSNSIPANGHSPLLSSNSFNHHAEEKEPSHKEDKFVNSLCSGATEFSSINGNLLDRSKSKNEVPSSTLEEPKDGEGSAEKDGYRIKDVDHFVPDSLDFSHDRTCDDQPNFGKEKENCNQEDKLVSGIDSVGIAESIVSESPQGEEACPSNANSEKSNFDSVGEDITKSMMSFLLPQALPLLSSKKKLSPQLKTFSRKKRRVLKPPKNAIGTEKIHKEHKEPDLGDIGSHEGTHAKNSHLNMEERDKLVLPNPDQGLGVSNSSHEMAVVPDSLIHAEACSDAPQASLATLDDEKNRPHKLRLPARSKAFEKSSVCDKNCGGKNESLERRENGLKSVSCELSCTEKSLCGSTKDTRKNSYDLLSPDIHIEAKELKTTLEHNEGPSVSCVEESRTHVNELPKHSNHIDQKNIATEELVTSSSSCRRERAEGHMLMSQGKMGLSSKPLDLYFVGRYAHPRPISLLLLSTNGEELCICVLCGTSSDQDRKLFMYKLSMKQQMFGCPSFIGQTTLHLPHSTDACGREIPLDRNGLQLTPDGHSLILSNSISAPSCREGDFRCSCSTCISNCNEKTGLKVVQVKHGYISVVLKLMTAENVLCVLVREPNYLIGIEESGILHIWVMNSTWSDFIEECDLSTSDCIFPCIVELKNIPNSAALVLGHNGFGEFGIWDISKRIFVARFSSPGSSIFRFLPISVFKWQRKNSTFRKPCSHGKEEIDELMASTRRSLSKQDVNQSFDQVNGDDLAIWVLISSTCNSDPQNEFQSSDHKMNNGGSWRLGLMVENRVILGSVLDHRGAAIGASSGDGIIGTEDGVVYKWDLSTGTKLCDLHHFQGSSVSCIATDDSRLSPLAIAGGDQLLVYVHSQKGHSDANATL